MFCTDCDYCGNVKMCFEDEGGGVCCSSCAEDLDILSAVEAEDDGQPSEYEEWQDLHGGDDWDHGQYDDCF